MEELNNLEQPNIVSEDSHADESGVECGQSLDTVLGSNSKFKSVDALNTAYNNLQAEFTKKCQHLRELEKSIEEKSTPRYKLDSWSEELSDFFENNPKATQYSKEIAKMILENEDLAKKSDCLKLAWANILSEKFVEQSDLASNQEFLEKYIYSNENIKDEIIKKIKEIEK